MKTHIALAAGLLLASGCSESDPEPPKAEAPTAEAPAAATAAKPAFDRAVLAAFAPLPAVVEAEGRPLTEARVELGRMLYYENRISKNHDLSCNSCHQLDAYGVDGQATSPGHKKQLGARNSPTVYNAAGHVAQFWDGRAADVEEQAKGPVLNPIEMGMPDEGAVLRVLRSMPGYAAAFAEAFPGEAEPITYDNFALAVGAFERKLLTPGRWDAFLGGDDAALTDAEKAGLTAFVQTGCTTCHSGAYLGGHMYQKVGLVEPWPDQKDQGRYEVTGEDADRMMFKVPSLRNVARTGPYWHDGSEPDLKKAVVAMARHQLGKPIDDATAASIVTFLEALTGEIPTDYIARPDLPASTDQTPKPDPT